MKKEVAPVIDIFPQISMEENFTPEVIRQEVAASTAFIKCRRVYCVVTNEGYPMFSSPWNALLPEDNRCGNHAVQNIRSVGDGNALFLEAIHRQGKEAYAVFKPYEMGGGRSVAHGAPIAPYAMGTEDVGGTQTGYGAFLSEHPEYAVARFPYDAQNENAPITCIELEYLLDAVSQRCDPFSREEIARQEDGLANAEMEFAIYVSNDNGVYTRLQQTPLVEKSVCRKSVQGMDGFALGDGPIRVLNVCLRGLNISQKYVAVVLERGPSLPIIPQTMARLFCAQGEVLSTATAYVRESLCPEGETHTWGNEGNPHVAQSAKDIKDFQRAGFEFDWHGSGFWGDGWLRTPVICLGRGKRKALRGTPCEGYEQVRAYWLSFIEKLLDMGYDGIDLRLQNHSGMVSDWTQYGWNEPIRQRYQEMFGKALDPAAYDPMDILRVRGSYYLDFVREARALIHSRGKKLQLHLREAWEHPSCSHEFNQMAFWAMPKVLPDWQEAVDLADEITLKDYHFNHYNPMFSQGVKQRCAQQNKPVWIHLYMEQGKEMNEAFLRAVSEDAGVSGILLYEMTHSVLGATTLSDTLGLVCVHGGVVSSQTPMADAFRRFEHLL